MNAKLRPLLYAATVALIGTACSNDHENLNTVDLNKPIELQIAPATNVSEEMATTRIAPGATGFTTETVGVYCAQSSTASITGYNTWTSADGLATPIYWDNATTDRWSFIAVYPATESTATALTLPTDYSTTPETTYESADKLWGKTEDVAPTNNAIAIDLSHRMSEVIVTLVAGTGYTDLPTINSVAINGTISTGGEWDLATGAIAISGSSSTATSVTTWAHTDGYRALFFPGQTFTEGEAFVTISTSDGDFVYNYDSDSNPTTNTAPLTLAESTQYKFTLHVNRGSITLGNFTISPWTTSTETDGNADMVIN